MKFGKCVRGGYRVVSELPGSKTWNGWVGCVCHACMLVIDVFFMNAL